MKLKIITATLCMSVMAYSGASLAETASTEPSTNCKACQCTLDNYLGAWPAFISSARSIYEIAQDGSQLKENIKTDLNQVCGPNNDYSHNHMKNFFQHITDNAISKSDKNYAAFETDYITLNTQYSANEKRVHDWKACPKTDSNGKACSKKACSENPPHPDDYSCWPCKDSYAPPPAAQGCDLGTAGTPCENTTITCDTIS